LFVTINHHMLPGDAIGFCEPEPKSCCVVPGWKAKAAVFASGLFQV